MTDDVELSDDQRAELARLKQELGPPPHLEGAVVDALKQRGLLADPRRRWVAAAMLAAAVFAGFAAGVFIRRERPADVGGPQFVLLLYAGDDTGVSPSRREEYLAWARTVAARGTTISGLELVDSLDAIVTLPSSQTTPAQPRGFFVIRVSDVAEARRIAETCPHLQHGGRIVLRRVVS